MVTRSMWFGMVSGLVSNRGIVFHVHYSIIVSLLILDITSYVSNGDEIDVVWNGKWVGQQSRNCV